MPDLRDLSAKIRNYKCFGGTQQGFDTFLPINVIIGRNNAGKSTLLELVERGTQGNVGFAPPDWHKGAEPEIILEHPLAEDELRNVFLEGRGGTAFEGDQWAFGKQWIRKRLTWRLSNDQHQFVSLDPPLNLEQEKESYQSSIAVKKRNPLKGLQFRQIAEARNIGPEPDDGNYNLDANGQHATKLLHAYLNKANLPRELAKKDILDDLNLICKPDSVFTEIETRQHPNNAWEIFLGEEGKGLIALSKTGSGFKTILLVLIILHLVPHHEQKTLSEYIFAFEELENNLHPAILRRLLLYLRQKAASAQCIFLLTTHSSVVIDLFSKDDNAQIIHVTHDNENALAKSVTTYVENKGVLDDLDVRASDLLQANGIIWVEGPSDRIYLNRWIALWSDNALQEGTHYQCVFYGGKLLAHLSAEPEGEGASGPVNILHINRNAIVLIDSDKSHDGDSVTATKQRIQSEIESIGGLSWITDGRAIENYLPQTVLEKLYPGKTISPVKRFEKFDDYLEGIEEGLGKRFLGSKVPFAEKVCEHFQKNDITSLDLAARVPQLVANIRGWNRLGELTEPSANDRLEKSTVV